MSSILNKSVQLRPPLDAGSNEFGVLKFTGGVAATETTHKADALPASLSGQFIEIRAVGGDVHFGFSTSASAEIDSTVSATAAGASAKVGGVVLDGTREFYQLPQFGTDTWYFVRESSAVGTVAYIRRATV
jgi:hypothetical protein